MTITDELIMLEYQSAYGLTYAQEQRKKELEKALEKEYGDKKPIV